VIEDSLAHKSNTREEIIASAYQLFLERGYHGTSMRQIARHAGIALGGIYNHFASKEDIFLAVLVDHYPLMAAASAMQAALGETVEELLRNAASLMLQALSENPEFLNLLFIELVEFKGQHVTRLFETFYPQVLLFTLRLSQWQSELRPVPLPILTRAFLGLFFSYFITDKLIGGLLPVEFTKDAFESFVDIYLHGILAESKPVLE
jgi:AcrR family transcriptional regulator